MGGDAPYRSDGQLVNVANLGDRQGLLRGPVAGLEGLAVRSLCGVGVAGDLHVLPALLVPHGPSLGKQGFDSSRTAVDPFSGYRRDLRQLKRWLTS